MVFFSDGTVTNRGGSEENMPCLPSSRPCSNILSTTPETTLSANDDTASTQEVSDVKIRKISIGTKGNDANNDTKETVEKPKKPPTIGVYE